MRFSIRRKIVLPFIALVLFVGIVGTAVVMTQVARTTTTQFDGTLLRAGSLASDHLAVLEADRLAQLRAAANTLGVPQATLAGNRASLAQLLSPLVANAQPSPLSLTVLDRGGQPILTLQAAADGSVRSITPGVGFASQPEVQSVLHGVSDAQGDKYLFERADAGTPALDWAAPIRLGNTVVGAAVITEPVASVAAGIQGARHNEVAFYSPSGQVLASTLGGMAALSAADLSGLTEENPRRLTQTIGGHQYGVLVAPWIMRGRSLGYLGAAVPADAVQAALAQFAIILALVFGALALLVIVVGLELARRITSPIERLVIAMHAVASGDLGRRAPPAGQDEIGVLTSAFNTMAVELGRKTAEVEDAYFRSLEALARAIDARDPYTFEHSSRVSAISLEIATGMALDADGRKALRRSGLLHDFGKIGVSDGILLKNGPLDEAEWDAIRKHPVIGYEMLKDVAFLKPSLDGIRHHHERWDGTGYPDRLKGEAIPLQARIVGVADAFDAMTSDRAYRKGYSVQFAVRTIHAGSGSQFDPAAVKGFEARLEEILALLSRMGKTPMPHAADIRWTEEAA
ncbi:MAG TPA: HD domain-containing phosphohydrolase [Candidatus Limnocylindrales bacterium]|nr:HD domain-containing phosphohydrolase [Candidatus Limnocylindrales bacterium]